MIAKRVSAITFNINTKNQIKVMTDLVQINPSNNEGNVENGKKGFKPFKKGLPERADRYPEHVVRIAMIVKNNAEIRRFTALGIINYLTQKGELVGNKKFVSFKWNKFSVKCDGLSREYFYTEPFFINCLIASFTSFGASATRTINDFTNKEINKPIDVVANVDEINNITELNDKHQNIAVEQDDNNKEVFAEDTNN